MKIVSGIALLDCDDVRRAAGYGECHPQCHHDNRLIHFCPRDPDGKACDWSLKVEADVCCTMWHVVFGLPRSFWEKASVHSSLGREDWFASRTEKPRPAAPVTGRFSSGKVKSVQVIKKQTCLICGRPSVDEVCEKCI